ncbi:MAG: UDP-N-acetylmuramate--L-alanine ligase [Sumerlaeia bacterium]
MTRPYTMESALDGRLPASAHLIGIGGAGMSAIARALLAANVVVSGSDACATSESCRQLKLLGATVWQGHRAENLAAEADVVIVSTAIRTSNPELAAARERKLPVLHRSQGLALFLQGRASCLVAGTHGKTTTTAMLALCLSEGGFDPHAFVGGSVPAFGGNVRLGKGNWAVAEADESDGSFRNLPADNLIVTNVEPDHLDYWRTAERMMGGYVEVCERLPASGTLLICSDDPGACELRERLDRPALAYGIEPGIAHYHAGNVVEEPFRSHFNLYVMGKRAGRITLGVPGRQNIQNAVGAAALALRLGASFSAIARALENFHGVERRFQIKGTEGGVTVIDDYAHHPTEIRATLAAGRQALRGTDGRLIAVFQPHRYTRTRDFLTEFADSLTAADRVILTDIYAASEDPIPGVGIDRLAADVAATLGERCQLIRDRSAIAEALAPELSGGDLVLTLGAGDNWRTADELLSQLATLSLPAEPAD